MFDAERALTAYFEVDTTGNVRRLRAGHRTDPSNTDPLPSDLGGYRYSAFGRLKAADTGTPAPTLDGEPYEQPFRWQGRPLLDVAGGLYDFRARTWSPELGAFLEADKFEFVGPSTTLWSWPGQNPVRNRDTKGRFTLVSVNAAAVGAGIAATLAVSLILSDVGRALGEQVGVVELPTPPGLNPDLVLVGFQVGGLTFGMIVYAESYLARMARRGNVADTGIVNEAIRLITAGLASTMCQALALLQESAEQARDTLRLRRIKATQKAKGCRRSRANR